MSNTIELASGYYLDNFFKLTEHAQTWYADLLTPSEHQWLVEFAQLDKQSQCLLVRFYSRRGEWFRSDKLSYSEIPNIDQCLRTLAKCGFISLNPSLTSQQLATHLLTKPEILSLYPNLVKALKKEQLIASIPSEDITDTTRLGFDVIQLESAHMIELFLTLFFANTHQDLSQFVLDDLGLHQFERYQLSKARRFFATREQIDRLIELSQIANLYWQSDRKNKANLDTLLAAIPDPVDHDYVDRKREHMLNDIARDYERLNHLESALALFEQTKLPPSRERRARILDKLNEDNALSDIVTQMLEQPVDVSEHEVAQKLMQRVKRKQGLKVPRAIKPKCKQYHLALNLSQQRVELATKAHFESLGWTVFYCENALLNGLLGLALWDAIFAPIEGAFINAYQHRPLDLYHGDFTHKRHSLITHALERIEQGHTEHLLEVYQSKFSISNPFVQWAYLDETLLTLALQNIPHHTLVALFKVQLSDLKLYRNGMPDLIAFKDGQFKWIEVKGPGDKLQDNQWRWIKEFERLKVPMSVAYVENKSV
ncbi:nuclease [Vibrio galatheae]|uniref:phosphodiesterase I n=1 Tax=Vibrio galatheae TaxID=579748 RepID=A0A0F4NNC8_9VIBR|nr:VRR-NUC domain-containing protein [Vibrio galatheae]KJY84642.1 nuclease [Vibrio galatheae]